jgi:hypothetical protein
MGSVLVAALNYKVAQIMHNKRKNYFFYKLSTGKEIKTKESLINPILSLTISSVPPSFAFFSSLSG